MTISRNSFIGIPTSPTGSGAPGAVVNETTVMTTAENNYWGTVDASGVAAAAPSGVDYQPWCNATLLNCGYRLPTTISMQTSGTPAELGNIITMDTLVTADEVSGMQMNVQFDASKLEFQAPPASSHNDVTAARWYWDNVPESFKAVTGGTRPSGAMTDPPHASPAMLTGQSVATWKFKNVCSRGRIP